MPRSYRKPPTTKAKRPESPRHKASLSASAVPAAAAFSFLKQMKSHSTWTLRELEKTLRVSRKEAAHIAAVMEIQGYAKPFKAGEWMTTSSGEQVSGAKPPRFAPESVEHALDSLRSRIAAINKDASAPVHVASAVAFGDFLEKSTRVQAADAGIELAPHVSGPVPGGEHELLRELRAKSQMINVVPYQEWMALRTHRALMPR